MKPKDNEKMKTPKRAVSLSAFAMLNKRKIMKKKNRLQNSPARSLRSNTPVSLKKKAGLSKLVQKNGKTSPPKWKKNGAGSNGEGPGPSKRKQTPFTPIMPYLKTEGEKTFEWLIQPYTPATFYEEIFERRSCVVKRHNKNYYKGVFSCADLDKILREQSLKFSEDIDLTSYINKNKRLHNGDGRAYAAIVWDSYANGRSVRILKPQAYSRTVRKLCSNLGDYFGNFVGGNIYLTPPGTQGFAPHYDDIDAFVLQLEGQKQWTVYNPNCEAELLPRFSSDNFSQEELSTENFLDVVLTPGDLLYFPRGYIHQAKTKGSEHSLHLTLSAYQRSTWGDLLEQLVPRSLQAAFEENLEYRRALPRDYQSYMGVSNSDKDCVERTDFLKKTSEMVKGLSNYLCTDATVDQMMKDFIHSSLPPLLTPEERSCSIFGDGEFWKDGQVHNSAEIDLDTKVRLLRKGAVRVVMEESTMRLYHSFENALVYKEIPPQYIEMGTELCPAVECLLETYPMYVAVAELPLSTDSDKLDFASLLYDKGLLLSEYPLNATDV